MPRPTISKNHVAPLEQVDGCLAIYVALPERALQILVRLLWGTRGPAVIAVAPGQLSARHNDYVNAVGPAGNLVPGVGSVGKTASDHRAVRYSSTGTCT